MATSINEFEVSILLLIEDSDDDILITQRKIFRSSLKVGDFCIAKTLAEGIDIVQHKAVEVVLLDLNLPDSKGLDSLASLRHVYDGIIIVLTSIDSEAIGIDAIRMGADDYIVKSSLTEAKLTSSVTYSRVRRTMRGQMKDMDSKLAALEKLGA